MALQMSAMAQAICNRSQSLTWGPKQPWEACKHSQLEATTGARVRSCLLGGIQQLELLRAGAQRLHPLTGQIRGARAEPVSTVSCRPRGGGLGNQRSAVLCDGLFQS